MAAPSKVRVAIIGLGFRRGVHSDLPEPSAGRDVRHLPALASRSSTNSATRSASPCGTRSSKTCWPTQRRRHPHQHADSRSCRAKPGRAAGRQARGLHGADGHHDRRMPRDRRGPAASGKHYMMMETVVYSREFLFVKQLYEQRRAGPDPVPARLAPAGDGRLARLLGRPAADALRHALRQSLPAPARQAGRKRRLPRLGPHQRGADVEVWLAVRHRDGHDQDARLATCVPK